MIDWDKSIETVSGSPAKVISTDFRSVAGTSVVLQIEYINRSAIGHYEHDGKSEYGSPEIRNRKTEREGWINIYSDDRTGKVIYKTKEDAEGSSTFKIATIKIKWEE